MSRRDLARSTILRVVLSIPVFLKIRDDDKEKRNDKKRYRVVNKVEQKIQ